MLPHRTSQRGSFIGLEIGSHSVRAAEVKIGSRGATLQRYAQVDLPPGAVADGEVVDQTVVAAALKRLWSSGKFSHKRVVVGVSSQRAIVRQADVPAMSDEELRSALRFEAQDLIPIPVEEAVLDFSTIDAKLPVSDPSEPAKMRILLAAAQRDMVMCHLGALKAAGLRPVAVDLVSLALLRAIPSIAAAAHDSDEAKAPVTEAVIAIGSSLTIVAVRENGVPRFVRVLKSGGDDIAAARASDADAGSGPSLGRPAVGAPTGTMTATRAAVGGPLQTLINDIRGSLDFYLAQADSDRVDRMVVTGSGALVDGLIAQLQEALRHTVELANPVANFTMGKTGLSQEQLDQAVPYLVAPIGLALWATTPGRAMSLLPDEVLHERRQRHQTTAVAFAVTAVAALLGLAWTGRTAQVSAAQRHATQSEAKSTTLSAQVAKLNDVTKVQSDVAAHKAQYSATLASDVDWIRVLQQVTAVMPADIYMVTFSGQRTLATARTTLMVSDGTITISGKAFKGPESVANWIRALETIPGLNTNWTTSIIRVDNKPAGPPTVTFTTSASVGSPAESQRSIQAGVNTP